MTEAKLRILNGLIDLQTELREGDDEYSTREVMYALDRAMGIVIDGFEKS